MPLPAVHWHEGMFLRPQHFQTDQRRLTHLMGRSAKWDCHYNWGLRGLDLGRVVGAARATGAADPLAAGAVEPVVAGLVGTLGVAPGTVCHGGDATLQTLPLRSSAQSSGQPSDQSSEEPGRQPRSRK